MKGSPHLVAKQEQNGRPRIPFRVPESNLPVSVLDAYECKKISLSQEEKKKVNAYVFLDQTIRSNLLTGLLKENAVAFCNEAALIFKGAPQTKNSHWLPFGTGQFCCETGSPTDTYSSDS